jgi:hypothetical protein
MAHCHAGHGPCSRRWRGPRARPTATRGRPGLASADVARAAQLGRPAQRAVHGASLRARRARWHSAWRRRCTATQRRHPTGAWVTAEETGGSPAWGQWRGTTATGERRGGTATDPGIAGFRPRRSGRRLGQDGGARGEACGGGSEGLSGGRRDAIGMTFKPPRVLLDSAAHGSQSRLGARDTATDRRAPRVSRLRI